ncbi:MAG: flagellar basal body rod protein FlgC [Chloroflexota bacterium]|nr:MAG: flagellar basal body rod protein FlgC [Chloroflexota bacterium]
MSVFAALRISASGLNAQRLRMDVITNNIANAETTRTPEGGAFRRQQVLFSPRYTGRVPFFSLLRGDVRRTEALAPRIEGIQPIGIVDDPTPSRRVYDPSHPDSGPDGFVEYPNVNMVTEMTDMMSATRSYEANVTVFNAAKAMAQRAIDLAR